MNRAGNEGRYARVLPVLLCIVALPAMVLGQHNFLIRSLGIIAILAAVRLLTRAKYVNNPAAAEEAARRDKAAFKHNLIVWTLVGLALFVAFNIFDHK